MAPPPKLKIMVASTVYRFEEQLKQLCGVLESFGYEVWNSDLGTLPVDPRISNLENCILGVRNCDLVLGVILPFYGSGIVGERSITHEEIREAVRLGKPRFLVVHHHVTFARNLLKRNIFNKDGSRSDFQLQENPVMDDLRVIDLYHDAIQNDVEVENRTGNWVQEFTGIPELLLYVDSQLKDVKRIRQICQKMTKQ